MIAQRKKRIPFELVNEKFSPMSQAAMAGDSENFEMALVIIER